jgi:hypothetical protein
VSAHRAPRLGSDQRLAPRITRLGRFRRIDPLRSRPLPRLPAILAGAAWALLLEESFRRARKPS